MASCAGEEKAAGTGKCIITPRGGLRLRTAPFYSNHERIIAWKIPFPTLITGNSSVFAGWCISAATMSMETVCCWMTAGNHASAFKAFPVLYSANISGPQSCRWTGNWKQVCFTRTKANAAASAGRCSVQVPTGGNTVPTAPLLFTASKRPRANVGAGPSVDN